MSVADRSLRAPRMRRRFAVQYGAGHPLLGNGFTLNLSARGMALSASSVQKPGTRLFFELRAGERPCRAEGQVVWARRGAAALALPNLLGVALSSADETFFSLLHPREEPEPRRSVEPKAPPTPLVPPPPRFARLERHSVALPFAFGPSAELPHAGTVRSSSPTGLAFESPERVAAGSRLFFRVELAPGQLARGEGQVVWVRPAGPVTEHGLRLTQIDEGWYRFVLGLGR